MSRILAREAVFKLVFSTLFNADNNDFDRAFLSAVPEEVKLEGQDLDYIKKAFFGIKEKKSELSALIEKNLIDYALSRIYRADFAILLVAVYELNFSKEIPQNVVINEAVELAKKYSTDNSFKFINGVLSRIAEAV